MFHLRYVGVTDFGKWSYNKVEREGRRRTSEEKFKVRKIKGKRKGNESSV